MNTSPPPPYSKSSIDALEPTISRLQELSQLVRKYFDYDILPRHLIRLTIDLDYILRHVDSNLLNDDEVTRPFGFAEHWHRNLKFLRFVATIFPSDGHLIPRLPYFEPQAKHAENLIECSSLLDQCRAATNLCSPNKRTTIICPDRSLQRLLNCSLSPLCHKGLCSREISSMPKQFMDAIKQHFTASQHPEQIAQELAFLLPEPEAQTTLTDLSDWSTISSSDQVIVCSTGTWSSRGSYWIHPGLLKTLKIHQDPLEILTYATSHPNSFYLYSNKDRTAGAIKKNSLLCIGYDFQQCPSPAATVYPNRPASPCIITSKYFALSPKISASSLHNFVFDPGTFFIRSVLNLKPENYSKPSKLSKLYKDLLLASRTHDLTQINYIVSQTKSIDVLYGQKLQNISSFVLQLPIAQKAKHNITIDSFIPELQTTISAKFDCIQSDNTIVSYHFSHPASAKDILSGRESSLLTQCLVLQYALKPADQTLALEIWHPNWHGEPPLSVTKINFSTEVLSGWINKILEQIEWYHQVKEINLENFIAIDTLNHFLRRL